MASGTLDFTPEIEPLLEAILPLGVTIVSREPYGGAVRATIQGPEIDEGKTYQIVSTSEAWRRCYELKASPYQETPNA